MSYNDNLYYNPEKNGLTQVGELEYSSGNYEFDTRVVWHETTTGRLLTSRDSGYSCPIPFEDDTVDNADDITGEYENYLVSEWKTAMSSEYGKEHVPTREEVDALVAQCRAALK